jgi:hypothetical protein
MHNIYKVLILLILIFCQINLSYSVGCVRQLLNVANKDENEIVMIRMTNDNKKVYTVDSQGILKFWNLNYPNLEFKQSL